MKRDPGLADFLNYVAILRSMDHFEIEGALSPKAYETFRSNPISFLQNTTDDCANAIWLAVRKRSRR